MLKLFLLLLILSTFKIFRVGFALFCLKKSFKGNFKKVPILKLIFLEFCLWIPITLLFAKFKIGEPEDPYSVQHVSSISKSGKSFNNP